MTHTIDIEKLAITLSDARADKGWTQQRLAIESGIDIGFIRKLEQRRDRLSTQAAKDRVKVLFGHLNIPESALENGAAEAPPKIRPRPSWSRLGVRGTVRAAAAQPATSIVETEVGQISPPFAPGKLAPDISPSIADETTPSNGTTPWAKAPVHEPAPAQKEEPLTRDPENEVIENMGRQLERIPDSDARRRVLIYLGLRYAKATVCSHGIDEDE